MSIVEVNNIAKNYFSPKLDKFAGVGIVVDKSRVKGVSFNVNEGELFGIIGPDGAGKTTLFRLMTTLLIPNSGEIFLDGLNTVDDYKKIRHFVGYMPGRFSLYQDLSVEENLKIFASVFNTTIEENYHLIEDIYVQIEPFKTRLAGKLSGGMKQKLALCCALIHKPKILFLDEPTTGVDPVSRKEFWEMLKRLKAQGITVIVSTPYMDEASMCDRIALMMNGGFLKIDSLQNIIDDFDKNIWQVKGLKVNRLLKDLRCYDGVDSCFAFGDSLHLTSGEMLDIETLKQWLISKGFSDIEVEPIKASIEDCFMDLSAGIKIENSL